MGGWAVNVGEEFCPSCKSNPVATDYNELLTSAQSLLVIAW
jgi:hypothetical protein